ncbi:MAG TPA: hypothetical protein VN578_09760 [Candidatus Binatia bacterium]|nr:hypothetical protein [Candidatus Binatia bacterium]
MKNTIANSRLALRPNFALLPLCLALVAGNGALALANAHYGTGGHPGISRTSGHSLSKASGLQVDWVSWIRRFF